MPNRTEDSSAALANCLTNAEFPGLPNFQRGKVRDSYDLPDGRRVMVTTDRQSAFDIVFAAVPYKGQVLNETARFWFEETRDICPNHVIDYPDPNAAVAMRLDMLPVEMVVRDYLTGSTETSIWPMYERGERHMYGHTFPDGLVKNQKLPGTILTPTTKADVGGHDAPITATEIVKRGLLSQKVWDELAEKSLALFARGCEIAAANGLILVDTKYEFGVDENGQITIADEIHTPDSSRYWMADSYEAKMRAGENPESLDKEFLRLWISECCDPYKEDVPEIPLDTLMAFSEKYVKLFELVTGRTFEKPLGDQSIRDRVRDSLEKAFPDYFN